MLYHAGPPPQYTPEDLSPEDPMLQHPGDLDLDDPSSLPLTERPPDLPPPMAMLRSNRPRPSNYHDDPRKLLFFAFFSLATYFLGFVILFHNFLLEDFDFCRFSSLLNFHYRSTSKLSLECHFVNEKQIMKTTKIMF